MHSGEKAKWWWLRWGDYNIVWDVFDLLGSKTVGISMLSNWGMFAWLWEPGAKFQTAFLGLFSMFVVAVVSVAYQLKFRDRKAKTLLAEFFPTVDDLRPASETFGPGNEIHAYFLSGEGPFSLNRGHIKSVKRLILPLPDERNLSRLQAISNTIDFKSQIEKFRNLARGNRKESVRYYKEFTGVSLLFCNPESSEGWVQVGIILPECEPLHRQHFKFYRKDYEKAFLSLYGIFNKMWDDSLQNTEEEDMMESYEEKD